MSGTLVLIATPIGNLGDLSPRAIAAISECDALCCEDTRRTGLMLNHFGLAGKTYIVVNEHTEHDASREVVERLLAGETIGLVTDAAVVGQADPEVGDRIMTMDGLLRSIRYPFECVGQALVVVKREQPE